jgi:hypothetical protein
MRRAWVCVATIALTAGLLSLHSAAAVADAETGNCNVLGGGRLADGSSLEVSVRTIDGQARGTAQFATSAGRFLGDVVFVNCRRDGGGGPGVPGEFSPNIAEFEGSGTFDGVPGYDFVCTVHDHGEANIQVRLPDEFVCVVASGESAVVSQDSGLVVAGNFQLLPPLSSERF